MQHRRADRLMEGALWAAGCLLLYWACCGLLQTAAHALVEALAFADPARSRLEWAALLAATLLAAVPPLALGGRLLPYRSMGLCWLRRAGSGWFVLLYLLLTTPLACLASQLPGGMAPVLPQDGVARWLAFGQLCIASALTEELIFRGVVQGLLRPFGAAAAVTAQAVCFAAMHSGAAGTAFALPMGILFGCAAEYSGSVWVSAALHFLNNFIAFAGLWSTG